MITNLQTINPKLTITSAGSYITQLGLDLEKLIDYLSKNNIMYRRMIFFTCILHLHCFKMYAFYDIICPSGRLWYLRAQSICSVEKYICLLDYVNNINRESCEGPKSDPPGEKTVINSGNFDTKPCPQDRFQPFPFSSYQGNDCIFMKSICSEEGQIVYFNGTTKNDRECRCDYTRNFRFLSQSRQKRCSCDPIKEDCSCVMKPCSEGEILSQDYSCIIKDVSHEHYNCEKIEIIHQTTDREFHETQEDTRNAITRGKEAVIATTVFFIVVILITVLFVLLPKHWKPQKIVRCLNRDKSPDQASEHKANPIYKLNHDAIFKHSMDSVQSFKSAIDYIDDNTNADISGPNNHTLRSSDLSEENKLGAYFDETTTTEPTESFMEADSQKSDIMLENDDNISKKTVIINTRNSHNPATKDCINDPPTTTSNHGDASDDTSTELEDVVYRRNENVDETATLEPPDLFMESVSQKDVLNNSDRVPERNDVILYSRKSHIPAAKDSINDPPITTPNYGEAAVLTVSDQKDASYSNRRNDATKEISCEVLESYKNNIYDYTVLTDLIERKIMTTYNSQTRSTNPEMREKEREAEHELVRNTLQKHQTNYTIRRKNLETTHAVFMQEMKDTFTDKVKIALENAELTISGLLRFIWSQKP